ncbi:TonB family protein [Moritella viscosa]|nr:TonB family protein [Moritella viscosa]
MNVVLVLFIYQIVTATSINKSQNTITLDFRQFKNRDLSKQDPLPEKLAKMTKKPEFKKLARPKPSITTTHINAIKKVSFPLMTAEKFNITPTLLAIEQPNISAKNSIAIQVNSGLISAKPVYQLPPHYPPRAKKNGIEGYVTMQIYIANNGKVTDIKIISEEPKGIFANSAMKAAYRWRFQPPTSGSTPWQILKVRYELKK